MTRIGVISDTHIPKSAHDLPERVYEEFKKVDMILHAGDLTVLDVFKKLGKIAKTYAVCGNMDMPEVRAALPQKDIIKVGCYKIGLIHGYGPPGKILEAVKREFARVDIVVFGHAHRAYCEKIGKTLFFNPGTPTDRVFAAYNSFGILEIDKEIAGTIIRL